MHPLDNPRRAKSGGSNLCALCRKTAFCIPCPAMLTCHLASAVTLEDFVFLASHQAVCTGWCSTCWIAGPCPGPLLHLHVQDCLPRSGVSRDSVPDGQSGGSFPQPRLAAPSIYHRLFFQAVCMLRLSSSFLSASFLSASFRRLMWQTCWNLIESRCIPTSILRCLYRARLYGPSCRSG